MTVSESNAPEIKLSIIATVRNESDTIPAFIDSLLSQSYRPDEIIIVDGESTDGTTQILREFESAGKIVLIVQSCNIAEGRNLGIAKAKNPYIAVTDAGCKVDSHWLLHIAQCFASAEKPDVVAGNFKFETHSAFEEAVVLGTFHPDRASTPAATYFPSSRSVAFTKQAWEAAKGYPDWLYAGEDTLFNIRLRQLGFKFIFAEQAFVVWRPRETWKALGKQRFNFARGNARTGFSTTGYLINIRYHAMILAPLLALPIWPAASLLSLIPLALHIKNNLWPDTVMASKKSTYPYMVWRILAVKEFIRLTNIAGFIYGRLDRKTKPEKFVDTQYAWMGCKSLDELTNKP